MGARPTWKTGSHPRLIRMQEPASMAFDARRLISGRQTRSPLHTRCTLAQLTRRPAAKALIGNNGPDRFKGMCDKNGCDLQPYRLGEKKFFGPGSDFSVDSTQLVQVTTDDFCVEWDAETKDGTNFAEKGGLGVVDKAFEQGVVLVMSLWDDHDGNMLWLDSAYPVDSTDPGAARGSCATTSADPKDVESKQASSKVTFSDIRFGPIGTTTSDSPTPSPSPTPTPSPSPSPIPSSGCCSWAKPDQVQECGDSTAYCIANADNCVQCNGHWTQLDLIPKSDSDTCAILESKWLSWWVIECMH